MKTDLLRILQAFLRKQRHTKQSPWQMVALIALILGVSYALYKPITPAVAMEKGAAPVCTIKSVYDGDTITVICPEGVVKVRVFGIDAPEMEQKPWGEQSRDLLRTWIPVGGSVRLRVKDRDRYGRTVAQILLGEQDAGLEMVRYGRAIVYTQYNHDPAYPQAQNEAQAARRGIWAEPGGHQNPALWRKLNPRR